LLELAGDREGAAAFWADRGIPYQRILVLGFSDDARAIQDAIDAANGLAAGATADRLRARLRELGHGSRRGRSRSTLANPGGLTRRQTEVIALLADQLTNQQIADRLYISPKTVDHHVSAILRALGVAGRHEAAVWARDQGLA
jgi:DNA-binding NarL/FixJ family response regulator